MMPNKKKLSVKNAEIKTAYCEYFSCRKAVGGKCCQTKLKLSVNSLEQWENSLLEIYLNIQWRSTQLNLPLELKLDRFNEDQSR